MAVTLAMVITVTVPVVIAVTVSMVITVAVPVVITVAVAMSMVFVIVLLVTYLQVIEIPKDPVILVVGSCREEQALHGQGGREGEGPETGDRERVARAVRKLSLELSVFIEDVDPPITEIPDEDRILQVPEPFIGYLCDSPGRVQLSVLCKVFEKHAARSVDVDEAVAQSRFVVLVIRPFQFGIRDEQITVDILDAERRKPGGD